MNSIFNINVCRVCLQNDQNYGLNEKDMLEKFEFTTRLQISKEDNLPKAICSKCTKRLKVAYDFIKTAHESEKNLKRFIEKICSEFREVAQGKRPHNKVFNEENLIEDDILSLLDGENRQEILSGDSFDNVDNRKEGIDCSFSKEILLIHASNEIDSSCESNLHLMEIPTPESSARGNCDEADENHEVDNSQGYTSENILESNEDYDVSSKSTELEIEDSGENHDYDMIINAQDDSTQCISINNDEGSAEEEENQKYDAINNNDRKEEGEEYDVKKELKNKIANGFKSTTVDNRFYCDKCNRDFSNKPNLNRHMQSHGGNKPFSCSKCIKSFSQKSTLKQHMYTHTGERPYVCQICNRGFTQHKSLMFHMRRHTGEKPFHCEYCLITFRQKDALRIHILKHHVAIERDTDGVEIFSCIICQKKFASKVEFKLHMKVHTANADEPSRTKKFLCRKCFKSFALKKSLIRHMRIHNDKNDDFLNECFDCDLQFSCIEEYREHISMCHQYACSLCPQFVFNTVQELKIHMLEHDLEQE